MTAYNLLNKVARANKAGRQLVLDPGDAGTIKAKQVGHAACIVEGGTTRSLESATRYGVNDSLLVVSQTSTITVNGVALSDGESARFVVTLDSSGAKQWVTDSASDVLAYLERAKTVVIPHTQFRVFDAQTTVLPAAADDDSDDIQIAAATIGTSVPTFAIIASNASITRKAVASVQVPNDYVAGSAISIVIPWTRSDAAGTSSALDIEVYRNAAPTVDINSTAAISINGAASGTATFVLTPTDLVPGELVFLYMNVAVVDNGTSRQDLQSVNWSFTPSIA